jgi:hypothetical protein
MTQTTRLALFGPVLVAVVSTSLSYPVYQFTMYICRKISIDRYEGEKKNSPKAQTTQVASFGPVYVVVIPHFSACRIFHSLHLIYAIKDQLVTKNAKEKRTLYLLGAQTTRFGVVWARLNRRCSPRDMSSQYFGICGLRRL